MSDSRPYDELINIVATLRSPGGCLWDIAQTHQSIKHNLVEEACEVVDAIDSSDALHLKEELGDLLLQVVFHARIAEEAGQFSIDDVVDGLVTKLRRRHPHVFGQTTVSSQEEILHNWEVIKAGEKERDSYLQGVPNSLPSLLMAQKLQDKAAKVGFDWPDAEGVLAKVAEEAGELAAECDDKSAIEWELGDLLFSLVNLARHLDVQAEFALRSTCFRFKQRFGTMETLAAERGKKMTDMRLEELDSLWRLSKEAEEAE